MIKVLDKVIGEGYPTFVIAEMSANHGKSFDVAIKMIKAAKDAGADAIKIQTYTPDTMTIDCDNKYFKIGAGNTWEGQSLYELYSKAYTPWEWQPKLKEEADKIGIILFSTSFDNSSVDFLENIEIPAYKIASFELVDLPLIKYVAQKQKPMILSTGMASIEEITDAVNIIKQTGNEQYALLKCVSDYPANPKDMNLKTIPYLAEKFSIPIGLSDHTLTSEIAIASVALGGTIIEKHFTLSRSDGGPDSKFSIEPFELKNMISQIRNTEMALGKVIFQPTESEKKNMIFRRSIMVVQNIKEGAVFTKENIRSIRPGYGLSPAYWDEVIGKNASRDLQAGFPLSLENIE